jgi:hypothetical protein
MSDGVENARAYYTIIADKASKSIATIKSFFS